MFGSASKKVVTHAYLRVDHSSRLQRIFTWYREKVAQSNSSPAASQSADQPARQSTSNYDTAPSNRVLRVTFDRYGDNSRRYMRGVRS